MINGQIFSIVRICPFEVSGASLSPFPRALSLVSPLRFQFFLQVDRVSPAGSVCAIRLRCNGFSGGRFFRRHALACNGSPVGRFAGARAQLVTASPGGPFCGTTPQACNGLLRGAGFPARHLCLQGFLRWAVLPRHALRLCNGFPGGRFCRTHAQPCNGFLRWAFCGATRSAL